MSSTLVFFGSSDYSVPVLQKLLDSQVNVISVVTTPDKPVGRHLKLTPNPVKILARKNNIPVIKDLSEIINHKSLFINHPVALVAAYGKIIPQEILDTFHNRIFNIHPSLLPKYRGASPLQQQILDGIKDSGVTIIQIDARMDHGPIVAQEKDVILPEDTTRTLGTRLFAKGADLFINEVLLKIRNLKLKIQADSQATYTKKLTRESGYVEYSQFKKFFGFRDLRFGYLPNVSGIRRLARIMDNQP